MSSSLCVITDTVGSENNIFVVISPTKKIYAYIKLKIYIKLKLYIYKIKKTTCGNPLHPLHSINKGPIKYI